MFNQIELFGFRNGRHRHQNSGARRAKELQISETRREGAAGCRNLQKTFTAPWPAVAWEAIGKGFSSLFRRRAFLRTRDRGDFATGFVPVLIRAAIGFHK
ncbi:MAG: hypothetical protein HY298_22025 [Verrucomicrobia bacterium]|nr:hypothetical protein [Verrucomicrobiota bacterium]